MKIIKTFFVMLYIQLALQYGILPVLGYGTDETTGETKIWANIFFVVLTISFVAVQVAGCLSAATAVKMYIKSEYDSLKKELAERIAEATAAIEFYLRCNIRNCSHRCQPWPCGYGGNSDSLADLVYLRLHRAERIFRSGKCSVASQKILRQHFAYPLCFAIHTRS